MEGPCVLPWLRGGRSDEGPGPLPVKKLENASSQARLERAAARWGGPREGECRL